MGASRWPKLLSDVVNENVLSALAKQALLETTQSKGFKAGRTTAGRGRAEQGQSWARAESLHVCTIITTGHSFVLSAAGAARKGFGCCCKEKGHWRALEGQGRGFAFIWLVEPLKRSRTRQQSPGTLRSPCASSRRRQRQQTGPGVPKEASRFHSLAWPGREALPTLTLAGLRRQASGIWGEGH